MRLHELVEASARVSATRSRLEKVEQLAEVTRRMPAPLVAIGVAYLTGELPQGRVGVGYAQLRDLRPAPAPEATLGLEEIDRVFSAVKAASGGGAAAKRAALLGGLLARATASEQEFLFHLLIGELRQGALEGIVVEAVALAFGAPPALVRRATMLVGGVPVVAMALAREGVAALNRFELTLFRPVQPMLADSAADVGDAWQRLGTAAFELKLDGARVQVHKDGDRIEVYSRQLNRVTPAVPEIVERVARLPAQRLILDGEAIALSPARRPLPFQTTMRRFGRRLDVAALRAELPLDVSFFDVLRVDDQVLLDRPLAERWEALGASTAPGDVVPRIVAATESEAESFLARALADGHEGVMAKSLTGTYSAGRRGQ
ncbi:MAG TPA: ATP-dependent DNA ligase, partial [Polyangia bacterium]